VSGDDFAYWRAIRKYWTGEEDLVIIEQDLEITADCIPSFIKCYHHWCVYQYEMAVPLGWLNESFGCTKFSAELQQACTADNICEGDHTWDGLDITMGAALKSYGETTINPYAKKQGGVISSHVHGRLRHHHRYHQNPLTIRNGIVPGGTLHQQSVCDFCRPEDAPAFDRIYPWRNR
jgi:hypothetical protein